MSVILAELKKEASTITRTGFRESHAVLKYHKTKRLYICRFIRNLIKMDISVCRINGKSSRNHTPVSPTTSKTWDRGLMAYGAAVEGFELQAQANTLLGGEIPPNEQHEMSCRALME